MIRFSGFHPPPPSLPAMRLSSLFLCLSAAIAEAARSVLKSSIEVVENVLSIPEDPNDPSAWDFDWSFTGIRYSILPQLLTEAHLLIYHM